MGLLYLARLMMGAGLGVSQSISTIYIAEVIIIIIIHNFHENHHYYYNIIIIIIIRCPPRRPGPASPSSPP